MNNASGIWTLSKEHERMIQSTQRKMLRLIIQTKRRFKKRLEAKMRTKRKRKWVNLKRWRMDKEDEENQRSSENQTDDGHSSNTDCYQCSDISFMNDIDEETDTAEIKEEDWIEYMKRSTDEAMHGTDENCKNPMLDQHSQKNAMEIGDENRVATRRKMGSESSWMEP